MSKNVLTKSEKTTLNRTAYVKSAANVIERFIHSGFKSLPAVTTIVRHYDEVLTSEQIFKFWNFKNMDQDVLERMEKVLEQLKAE